MWSLALKLWPYPIIPYGEKIGYNLAELFMCRFFAIIAKRYLTDSKILNLFKTVHVYFTYRIQAPLDHSLKKWVQALAGQVSYCHCLNVTLKVKSTKLYVYCPLDMSVDHIVCLYASTILMWLAIWLDCCQRFPGSEILNTPSHSPTPAVQGLWGGVVKCSDNI